MDWKDSNKVKDYYKAYRQANKERLKEYQKEYMKAWKEANKDKVKSWKEANKDKYRDYMKAYIKSYQKSDINANGETKGSIRQKSRAILKRMHLHIDGYEIHHCFGYEDPSKFIYISKALHLKIHKYLRDNNIDASSDHWMSIRDLVNDTDEFTYIKC